MNSITINGTKIDVCPERRMYIKTDQNIVSPKGDIGFFKEFCSHPDVEIGVFYLYNIETLDTVFTYEIFLKSIYEPSDMYHLLVFALGDKMIAHKPAKDYLDLCIKWYQGYLDKYFPDLAKIFVFRSKNPNETRINLSDPFFWPLFRRMLHGHLGALNDILNDYITHNNKNVFWIIYKSVYAGLEKAE